MGGNITKPEVTRNRKSSLDSIRTTSTLSAFSRRQLLLSLHPVLSLRQLLVEETEEHIRSSSGHISVKKKCIFEAIEKLISLFDLSQHAPLLTLSIEKLRNSIEQLRA